MAEREKTSQDERIFIPNPDDNIFQVARAAVAAAKGRGEVTFSFNNIVLTATEEMLPGEIVGRYDYAVKYGVKPD